MIKLFSDGGGTSSGAAASAAIIENQAGQKLKLVAFLGGATNNEAEIFAGLVGFALLQVIGETSPVHWVCDSEYVLKSATGYIQQWQKNGWKTAAKKPVKNQGLWRSYLELARGLKIKPQHVAGHSGHPENEACDAAATWAQMNGESLLGEGKEGISADVDSGELGEGWILLDGRDVLAGLRGEESAETHEPEPEALQALRERILNLGILGFDYQPSQFIRRPREEVSVELVFRKVELKLKEAEKLLQSLGESGEVLNRPLVELIALTKKLQQKN